MQAKWTFVLLLLNIITKATSAALAQYKCVQDNVLDPLFATSPGNYRIETVSADTCTLACAAIKAPWAGLQGGKYCLCSNYLQAQIDALPASTCTAVCAVGTLPCGGQNGVTSVYQVSSAQPTISASSVSINIGGISASAITTLLMSNQTPRNATVFEGATIAASGMQYALQFGDEFPPRPMPASASMTTSIYPQPPGKRNLTVSGKWTGPGNVMPPLVRFNLTVIDEPSLIPPIQSITCEPSKPVTLAGMNRMCSMAIAVPMAGQALISYTVTRSNFPRGTWASWLNRNITSSDTGFVETTTSASLGPIPAAGARKPLYGGFTGVDLRSADGYMYSTASSVTFAASRFPKGAYYGFEILLEKMSNVIETVNIKFHSRTCASGSVAPMTSFCLGPTYNYSNQACTSFSAADGYCMNTNSSSVGASTLSLMGSQGITIPASEMGKMVKSVFFPGIIADAVEIAYAQAATGGLKFAFRRARGGEDQDAVTTQLQFPAVLIARALPNPAYHSVQIPIPCYAGVYNGMSATFTVASFDGGLNVSQTYNQTLTWDCQIPVEGVSVTLNASAVAVNDSLQYTITISSGAPAAIRVINAVPGQNITKWISGPTMVATGTFSYSNSLDYTYLRAEGFNLFFNGTPIMSIDGPSNGFVVQWPVKPLHWVLEIPPASGAIFVETQNVTLTLRYVGPIGQQASNATATINFGDGTLPELLSITNGVASLNLPVHKYFPGSYNASVVVQNNVSSVTFFSSMNNAPTLVTVWAAITNVSANFLYYPIPGDSTPSEGGGPVHHQFPQGYNISMYPTVGAGVVEYYLVSWQNGTLIERLNATDPFKPTTDFIILSLQKEGDYNFTVDACNAKEGCIKSTDLITVTISGKIFGLTIDDYGMIVPPMVPKNFTLQFGSIGGFPCVMIDWGDNTLFEAMGESRTCKIANDSDYAFFNPNMTIGNPMVVSHIYREEKLYNMSVVAWNADSNTAAYIIVVATNISCSAPAASILEPSTGMSFKRSAQAVIEGTYALNCSTSNISARVEWKIAEFNESTLSMIREIDISTWPSWNRTQLVIPALALPYGYFRLQFTVFLAGRPIFDRLQIQTSAYKEFSITKTPLVCMIYAGGVSRILKGSKDFVLLKPGLLSVDPDDPNGTSIYPTRYEWSCSRTGEPDALNQTTLKAMPSIFNYSRPQTDSGCFGNGPEKLNITSLEFTLDTRFLYKSNTTYTITVGMLKDDRTAVTSLDIEVLGGNLAPLEVAVGCIPATSCLPPSVDGILINLDKGQFLARGLCTKGCDAFSKLAYQWTVTIDKGPGGLEVIPGSDVEKFPYGANNEDLAMSADFFQALYPSSPGLKFRLRLNIQDTQTNVYGFSEFYMTVNKPPTDGFCRCYASSFPFISIKTVIDCMCDRWQDPEGMGISTYQFVARRLDITDRVEEVVLEASSKPTTQFVPSPGSYGITCTIIDIGGAVIIVDVPILYNGTDPQTLAVSQMTSSSFEIVAPTAEVLQDLEKAGVVDALVAANPALADMVQQVEISMMQSSLSSLLTITELPGSSTSDTSSTSTSKVDSAVNSMSEALTAAAASLTQSNNLATPAQMSTAATTISSLASAVPPGGVGAAAISADFVDMAGSIFGSIGAALSADPGSMTKSTLTNLASAAVKTAIAVGPALGPMVSAGCDQTPPNPDMSTCPKAERDRVVFDPIFPPPVGYVMPSSPDIEKCCLVLQEKNRALGGTSSTIFSTTAQLLGALTDKVAVGEILQMSPVPGTTIQITKESPASLPGKEVPLSGSSIKIPESFNVPGLSGGRSVGISAVTMDTNPLVGENSDSEKITKDSVILTFDLTDESGRPVKVENLKDPIVIKMPRQLTPSMAEETAAALNCINATKAGGNGTSERVIYSTIEPSKTSDFAVVEIRMKDNSEPPDGLYVMVGRQLKPSLIKGYFETDKVVKVKDLPMEDDLYKFLAVWENGTGPIHVGVFELISGLTVDSVVARSNWDNLPSFFKVNLTKDYCIRVSDGGINFYNGQTWVSDGLQVSGFGKDGIQFKTTHLSTFGSGFFVQPNKIDFSSVFAKAGFNDNITIYMTLIVTFTIYILILIWARIKDKKDVTNLGALPLPDNNTNAKYIYEILTVTGDQNSAATHSQIFFILSGEQDDTGVRSFGKPTKSPRLFFQRGATDAFVLTTDRPLGELTFMRIWSDCSGSGVMLSWFCSNISIRDVQTGKKYDFVMNSWLSPADGDGQVDRLISIAGEEEKKQFRYLYDTQKSRNLRDGHLWFSVFTRPPRCRYTRCQRVSTCMALLYLSMLANAMWYGTVPDQPGAGALKFGPFAISQEQIGVGLMANLVVLPPSMLIIFLFRKARPRKLRKSRIDEALKDQRQETDAKGKGVLPKKRRFTLPWWCTIVAWILCLASIGVSIFFLWAYGVTFGNDKCTKWVTSLLVSFFSSILLVQPLKVLILAMICSAICKLEPDDDDADEDEEDPTLQWDEDYLVDQPSSGKKTKAGAVGVDTAAVSALREKRIMEKSMWEAMKRILFYSFYIWILIVISYNNRDPNAGLLRKTFEDTFIKPKYLNETDRFTQATTVDAYWKWVNDILVDKLRAKTWYRNALVPCQKGDDELCRYDGDRAIGLQGFLADFNNRMMGYAIMRQVRVKADTCTVHKQIRRANITTCADLSGIIKEDRKDYCTGWRQPSPAVSDSDCLWPEFRYSKASKYESLPHIGRLDSYSGGGYTFLFNGRERELKDRLNQLQSNQWLDTRTRAVIVEFATYNAHVNLFAIAKIVVEAIPGGGLVPAWRFDGIRLMRHFAGFGLVAIICEVSFAIFTIYFTVVAIRAMCQDIKAFLASYWSYVELIQLALSYTAIVLYIIRAIMTDSVTKQFEETMGNAYIPMQHVASIDEMFGYMISLLAFSATLSLLKLLRFNRSIGALSATMRICFDELAGFGFVFAVFLVAFVIMFNLLLCTHLFEWRTLTSSFETSIQIMLGKFEFGEIMKNNLFAGVMFFFFNISMSIIMINLLMTIIINSFEKAKLEIDNNLKDFEVMEFMIARMRAFVGMSARGTKTSSVQPVAYSVDKKAGGQENAQDMKEFPQKVDRMLEQINNVYFDGALDLSNKSWLKNMLKNKKQGHVGGDDLDF